MTKLLGKVAIVTGAGSGMGRAIAKLFAAEGARVVCADYNAKTAEETYRMIKESGGAGFAITTNVAKQADVEAMVKAALEAYGTLDVLVNNAGVMDNCEPVGSTPVEQWERVLGINLNGPFFGMRAAIPVFLEKGKGVIVNVASIAGLNGAFAGASYTASKHALVGLTKNTAAMYAKKNIRVNAIAPGAVNTNIGQTMTKVDPHGQTIAFAQMPFNPRSAEADEIAKLALFLASDDASFVNGAIVVADGGWTAF